jgi:hypothetical protein
MAEHGHYGGRAGETRQGIYVCTPNGKFLASINSNRAESVLEMMQRGLRTWEALPAAEREASAAETIAPRHRWEDSFPEDGLVLSVIVRDLPLTCDPALEAEVKWNQDRVWFSREEARQWLPPVPREGERHELPAALVTRLARLHLVDTVRGQTTRFERSEVEGSSISTRVLARDGAKVKIEISGRTKGDSADFGRESAHGVVTRLFGHALYDLEKGAFSEFEFLALGRRWGFTRYNARRRDTNTNPLGYVFRLAAPGAPRIAPAFVFDYDADWVIQPSRRR